MEKYAPGMQYALMKLTNNSWNRRIDIPQSNSRHHEPQAHIDPGFVGTTNADRRMSLFRISAALVGDQLPHCSRFKSTGGVKHV